MQKGVLYIVPTPVGNLEDMTFRAIKVLREADIILAEDTRTAGMLLQHFDITHGRLTSHHKFNEHQNSEMILKKLDDGANVALVSDAGTPGISDPGFFLVRTCADAGVEVRTLPGATACIPALVSSGLPCDRFCFEGFLPLKKGRSTLLSSLSSETRTMVFYESPRRLVATLTQMKDFFGDDRQCSVAREISKIHEEHFRGSLTEAVLHFSQVEPKGEIVLVVAGAPHPIRKEHKNKFKKEKDCGGDGKEEFK